MAALLKRVLEQDGHLADVAATGQEALTCTHRSQYTAILIEQNLPPTNAAWVCARLRARGIQTPVLMVRTSESEIDRIADLHAGVDDYLTKPFAFDDLYERLANLTRLTGEPAPHGYAVSHTGDLRTDSRSHRAWRGDTELDLSSREFALLRLFVSNPGTLLTRARILARVWDYDHHADTGIVGKYVLYLRRKIDQPFKVTQLQTVRGFGYRLLEEPISVRRVRSTLHSTTPAH